MEGPAGRVAGDARIDPHVLRDVPLCVEDDIGAKSDGQIDPNRLAVQLCATGNGIDRGCVAQPYDARVGWHPGAGVNCAVRAKLGAHGLDSGVKVDPSVRIGAAGSRRRPLDGLSGCPIDHPARPARPPIGDPQSLLAL